MNPLILFSVLMLAAAAAMLRLSDRALVRVLGVSSLMVLVPSGIFMTEAFNWRTQLTHGATLGGYILIGIVGVGAIFALACALSAVLRSAISCVRFLQRKKVAKCINE